MKITVKLPFRKSERLIKSAPPEKTSTERVRKWRQKLNTDPKSETKLQTYRNRKKIENQTYKRKIKNMRKSNKD